MADSASSELTITTQQAHSTLVFVDPSIRKRQELTFGSLRNEDVVVLRPGIPLLEQIAQKLKGKHGIKAIHVVSHGDAGAVLTQDERLDQQTLAKTPAETTDTIRRALSSDADMLFYGCNIASASEGRDFLRLLAKRTGTHVAASTNDTGNVGLGADWNLEFKTGPVHSPIIISERSQQKWQDKLTIGITVASNSAALLNALSASGSNGMTFTGTPTVLGAFSSNAYGTFTTTSSTLGMTSGAVFGTGNVSQISGTPSFFWDGAGTGNTSGSEFDRAALTFSFIPNPGVTKVAFRYILGSEEYNEYVGLGFSDNITIKMTGGSYAGTNVATVPGTSVGIDIDTINNTTNSAFYRDNTVATPPVPDSVLDGHTTPLKSISAVVPGTTYTTEIKVADFTDNRWNSALFVDYFGASLQLDLDSNNSSGAAVSDYQTNFTEGGAAVAIADVDRVITNFDTTTVQSATITLTNAKASDTLTYGAMPTGITAVTNTSVPGVITVTLTGAATIANYQTAISSILFSNSSNVPNTTTRTVTVVVSDGVTNSNTATASITITSIPTYLYTVNKSASVASIAAPGTVNYTITLVNTGDGNMTGMSVTDVLAQGASNTSLILTGPTGDGGVVGQFDIGETWVYTVSLPVTQARIDNGNNLVNTVSVTSTQTSPTVQTAQATTTITKNPALSIVKSANTAGPVNKGTAIGYTYLVTNSGNVTIANVSVSDVHNGLGTAPVPGSETLSTDVAPTGDSTDSASNGIWNTLAPGDTIRLTSSYVVTQADIDRGN